MAKNNAQHYVIENVPKYIQAVVRNSEQLKQNDHFLVIFIALNGLCLRTCL